MFEKNLETVLEKIKNGNNLGEKITLVGATKTVSTEEINKAVSLGLKVVAENKVQEFTEKTSLLKNCEQQFIGHLQTNKVKYLVGNVSLIQSVDSFHLADAINKESLKKNVVQNILLEINVGGELSKSGFNFDNTENAIREISKLQNVNVLGLMAMLPKSDDKLLLQNLCLKMRQVFDKLKNQGFNMQYLSMGMSEDYEIAIKNGSNMIRIGSLIFGKRNYGVN